MKRSGLFQLFILMFLISACSFLFNEELSNSDLEYIMKLGLLEEGEKIQVFSSSMYTKKSGNFVTNKRIATYWINKTESKSSKDFAFFQDIISIDSVDLTSSLTYASYLKITKKDGSVFKVYVDGGKNEYQHFVRTAIQNWRSKR